ncbi:TRFR-like protein [Mya arenaria]|uniref:TRFR-like protein n=1 Tax=Mya arenaria TaxID=6604 RepID=A0ABY7DMH0_MYAAR|nr:TRFR-like protein [Mya arenaria]
MESDNVTMSDLLKAEQNFVLYERIKIWYPPFLCFFGICGNIIAIAVLRKRTISSTRILLISLAVTDTLVLVLSPLKQWIMHLMKIDVRQTTEVICKIDLFLTYLLVQLSPWVLAMITVERAYSVIKPHLVRVVFTRRRTLISLAICIVCLSVVDSHLLYGYTLIFIKEAGDIHCHPRSESYETFMFNIFMWIDFAFAFAIPGLGIVTGNLIIIAKLRYSRHLQGTYCNERGMSTAHRRRNHVSHSLSQWTRTTVVINVFFVMLVLPSVAFGIGQVYWFPSKDITPAKIADTHLIAEITFMLMYTNNAINFVLYIMLGSRFRSDLISMCFCKRGNLRSTNGNLQTNSSSDYNVQLTSVTLVYKAVEAKRWGERESLRERGQHRRNNI